MSIQDFQFDDRLNREKNWQRVRAKPTRDNSVEWELGEQLKDKWVWLVTDLFEELPVESLKGVFING